MSGIDIDPTQMTEVAPGVLKKNENTYYIQCASRGTWHYCIKARLDKLIKKFGSIEAVGKGYRSREAKQEEAPAKVEKARKCSIPRLNLEDLVEDQTKKTYTYLSPAPREVNGYAVYGAVWDVFTYSGTKCCRAKIIEDNKGYCNGCPFYAGCRVELKDWKKTEEQADRFVDGIKYAPYELRSEAESIESRFSKMPLSTQTKFRRINQ